MVTEQVHKIRAIDRARLEYKQSIESASNQLQELANSGLAGLVPQESVDKALDAVRVQASKVLIEALDKEFRN